MLCDNVLLVTLFEMPQGIKILKNGLLKVILYRTRNLQFKVIYYQFKANLVKTTLNTIFQYNKNQVFKTLSRVSYANFTLT